MNDFGALRAPRWSWCGGNCYSSGFDDVGAAILGCCKSNFPDPHEALMLRMMHSP